MLLLLWQLHAASSIAWSQTTMLATVNDQPVSLNQVHYFLDRTLRNLPDEAERLKRSQATIHVGLQHCINREVILQHLLAGEFKTGDQEIDRQIEDWKVKLELVDLTLEQYLSNMRLTLTEFRRELRWQSSWRKYASKFVTVAHLKKRFEEKRRIFDGTEIRVAQILWKQTDKETLATAENVRRQLLDGKLDWQTAVKEHSQAASASNDGELGWIGYNGPMPAAFSKAAFEIEDQEFSKLLQTRYGLHLIRCIEVKNGSRTFADVVEEIREVETNRLFETVAQRHRPRAKVKLLERREHSGKK